MPVKTSIFQTDWITTRIESNGSITHTVPMNEKALEEFFREFEIIGEEAKGDGIEYYVQRRPICKSCADWFEGICDNEERELDFNNEAISKYGTVEGVAAIAATSPFYSCIFHRAKPRSDQWEYRKVCIPKTTRVFRREGE